MVAGVCKERSDRNHRITVNTAMRPGRGVAKPTMPNGHHHRNRSSNSTIPRLSMATYSS